MQVPVFCFDEFDRAVNEMRIVKMKCCQGNMNFQTCILLIIDAWPVNVGIGKVSPLFKHNVDFNLFLPAYPVIQILVSVWSGLKHSCFEVSPEKVRSC